MLCLKIVFALISDTTKRRKCVDYLNSTMSTSITSLKIIAVWDLGVLKCYVNRLYPLDLNRARNISEIIGEEYLLCFNIYYLKCCNLN